MSYATIEAAAQTILQALAAFAAADVVRANWRVLDSGGAPYAVLYPGPFEIEDDGDNGQKLITWTMYIEIYERYLDNGSSETALEATRQAVVDTLIAYPTLNGCSGVSEAIPIGADPINYVYDEDGGGPHFVMQRLAVVVIERAAIPTTGEFA